MKGINQAVSMIVTLIVAAAVLFLAMKLVTVSNKTADKTLKDNQLELICMDLGIHLADDTQDKQITEIEVGKAKIVGKALKNLGCKDIWKQEENAGNKIDLEAEASKCATDPNSVKGCSACALDQKSLCLTLENEVLQKAIKICTALKSAYTNCKSSCPSNWMQCLVHKDENDEENILKAWCTGEDPKEEILAYNCGSNS